MRSSNCPTCGCEPPSIVSQAVMRPSSRLSPGTAERSPSVVTTVQLPSERMELLLSHGPLPLYQHRLRRLNVDTNGWEKEDAAHSKNMSCVPLSTAVHPRSGARRNHRLDP